MLVAVLEKALNVPFFDRDVYVNVTGGIKVAEPAIDLAVAASILSTYKDVSWKEAAFFGEVGLTGEVRRVVSMEMRLRECERLHIKKAFCPAGSEGPSGVNVVQIGHVKELYEQLSGHPHAGTRRPLHWHKPAEPPPQQKEGTSCSSCISGAPVSYPLDYTAAQCHVGRVAPSRDPRTLPVV